MADNLNILQILKETGAFLEGHFQLSSGLHSGQYLQCAVILQHPEYAQRLCSELAKDFKKDRVTAVIGPALGGIIVSYEIARALNARSIFAERVDGKFVLRRNFLLGPEDNVLVVEDVLTTGGSVKEVIGLVKQSKANLVGVAVIVDRSVAGLEGLKFKSLLKMDIPTFRAKECPFCKKGIGIDKPGSKFLK